MAHTSGPAALHLHFDVVGGVRAEALLGALVGVGADLAAAEQAVAVWFGDTVALQVAQQRQHGVVVHAASLALHGVEDAAPVPAGRSRASLRSKRARGFVRDLRRGAVLESVQSAQAPPPDGRHSAGGRHGARRRRGAASRARAPLVQRLLEGAAATPADLVALVRAGELSPVVQALALRTMSTLAEALHTLGIADDAPAVQGPHAVQGAARVIAACALVDSMSPALISSTPLGVSSLRGGMDGLLEPTDVIPSPWLCAVMRGRPILERDEDLGDSDVVGAALVRVLAHRMGARGMFTHVAQAFGVSAAHEQHGPSLMRVLAGAAPPLPTRAGDVRGQAAAWTRALLDVGVDKQALAAALARAGAEDVHAHLVEDLRGQQQLAVDALAPAAGADLLVRVLWQAGAEQVSTTWADRRRPGVEEVTVPVGRGRSRRAVRVRVVRDEEGSVLSVRCAVDDVRQAARDQRQPDEVVRAEALAAWRRLAGDGPVDSGRAPQGDQDGEDHDDPST